MREKEAFLRKKIRNLGRVKSNNASKLNLFKFNPFESFDSSHTLLA